MAAGMNHGYSDQGCIVFCRWQSQNVKFSWRQLCQESLERVRDCASGRIGLFCSFHFIQLEWLLMLWENE
jgi:hypothetical protein